MAKGKEKNSELIWVIGGGRFGSRAVTQLRKRQPLSRFVVIDPAPSTSLPGDIECVLQDGITWFTDNFTQNSTVDKIIPALPRHLLAEWVVRVLAKCSFSTRSLALHATDFADELHPLSLKQDQVALSHADFLCPANCPEPDKICTHTGKPRPTPMYSLLAKMDHDNFTPLILQSRQFAPGVGGFYPVDLWQFLGRVKQSLEVPLLIGTACKCHGIVNGFMVNNR